MLRQRRRALSAGLAIDVVVAPDVKQDDFARIYLKDEGDTVGIGHADGMAVRKLAT